MRETTLTLPELGLIAGTRGLLGAGIGLLVSEKLSDSQRRAIGWTLVAVGVLTTVPLVLEVFQKGRLQSAGTAGNGRASEPAQSAVFE